jgi:predicted metal-binding protein
MVAAPHERIDAARASITLKIRGESRTLFPNNMSLDLIEKLRSQSGHSLQFWVEEIDMLSVCVMWWVAALQEGVKPSYSLAECKATFPADLTPDEIEVEQDDGTTPSEEVPSPEG